MHRLAIASCIFAAAAFAQSPLTTLNVGGNQGNQGGGIYFNLTVNQTITINQIDFRVAVAGQATDALDVYLGPTTYVGNVTNAGLWTLVSSTNVVPTVNDSLSIGPGFGWFTQLGGGSEAFPILVIDWKITEKLRLNTGSGLAASQGPGLTLSYALTDSWNIGLSGRYERTRFALEDRPGRSGGFGQEKSLPLVLQATWAPNPGMSFSVLAGAEFEGSLRLEDDQGERLASSEFDVAPVAGLAFSARF